MTTNRFSQEPNLHTLIHTCLDRMSTRAFVLCIPLEEALAAVHDGVKTSVKFPVSMRHPCPYPFPQILDLVVPTLLLGPHPGCVASCPMASVAAAVANSEAQSAVAP